MKDLQANVAAYYAATARDGDYGQAVRAFLVSTQTLNEHFSLNVKDKSTYLKLLDSSTLAGTAFVKAAKYARNVHQHVMHIVSPRTKSMVGGLHGVRTYAFWDEIPHEAHDKLHKGTKLLKPHYDSVLFDKEVTETMLEVLRFFAAVAPQIVHRDEKGEWTYFPLTNQPGMLEPRLHPEEPRAIADAQEWLNDRVPNGDARVVFGQVTVSDVKYVVGSTFVGRHCFSPFVETLDQVERDIASGFKYLQGNPAGNLEDITHTFSQPQGAVLKSRDSLDTWTVPVMQIQPQDDFCIAYDVDAWHRIVSVEVPNLVPEGVAYATRRARRLNAFLPPSF
ncbi:hypothetical protein GA0061083_2851 [Pseudarthrobacter enclensis]|uniref:Uncharacterized protein n=2 Tax=Pseudarthrobacter enclensis TaxID=993070 RepID=A0A0V8IKX1_9MICC|nr:hypothetical protein AS031_12575 [Pseudarthrobacter enclensis]SCC13637.1 hypothetical protein GA0061083_2851 [Pseudarthrobacter enclensis]